LRNRAVTVTLLILTSISIVLTPLAIVLGQLGTTILLVSPQDEGTIGQLVNVQGSIDTQNGAYEIWFGNKRVTSAVSDGYYVNANFTIPPLSGGAYTIVLRDVSRNINATYPLNVLVTYRVQPLEPSSPTQLQEGTSVVLNVTIAGAQSGTTYYANVTVELPVPLSTSYSRLIELSASGETAVVTGQVTYPDTAFQPEGSLTNYTGSYQVYFNETQPLGSLATNQFFVGFTDLSQYHREQSVEIRAIGYQPDENATISIKYGKTGEVMYSETVTASSGGIINSNWAVPSNALIGDYNITITPDSTVKLVPDSQLFTVSGYSVKIRTLNLAGEPVPQILVEGLDPLTNIINTATSGGDGMATIKLEKGNYTLNAFWNGVQVGEINVTVTGENAFDLTCELTNLKITVQNENGNSIPFVNLDVTYQYVTTRESSSKTGRASGQTGLMGNFTFNSILPGISYTINASIYGVVFNIGNSTVGGLPVQPISEVTILCPSKNLTLTILDYNGATIPNTRIELFEITSGLFHSAITGTSGTVTLEVTFGKYRLRIYTDTNILLNETVIEVFSDTQNQISCSLYNIQVSVTVVDYFEQPIPNVNVMLHGPGIGTRSATTQTDGTTTFSNVIGGSMQVIAYPAGMENSFEAVNLQIEEQTTITIKMAKYILIGAFLIEASVLVTFVIFLLAIILFVSMEVYRRRLAKRANSES
jgi:hypothetical protein